MLMLASKAVAVKMKLLFHLNEYFFFYLAGEIVEGFRNRTRVFLFFGVSTLRREIRRKCEICFREESVGAESGNN
jgi:hypothetical protein